MRHIMAKFGKSQLSPAPDPADLEGVLALILRSGRDISLPASEAGPPLSSKARNNTRLDRLIGLRSRPTSVKQGQEQHPPRYADHAGEEVCEVTRLRHPDWTRGS